MEEARIQVLIPTCNNVNELDETIQSVWNQKYNMDQVFITIVDFNSTDGTYEKALQYDRRHLGVYTKTGQTNRIQMVAEAARILKFVQPGGLYCFSILLYPGDIMYPECLQVCAKAFMQNYALNPSMVICEADIKKADGTIQHQEPLFPEDRIINGKIELSEYVRRGYQHQIGEMVIVFNQERYKSNGENNEQRYWNKAANINNERQAIYLKTPHICTKEVNYEDELEEILYRWEAIISIIRFYTSKYGHGFDDQFENLAKQNLARYALWRAFRLLKRNANRKDAEDCFMISAVIHPQIKSDKLYSLMEQFVKGNIDVSTKIETEFMQEA